MYVSFLDGLDRYSSMEKVLMDESDGFFYLKDQIRSIKKILMDQNRLMDYFDMIH